MIDAEAHAYIAALESLVDMTLNMRRLQRIYFRAVPGTPEKKRALDDALVAEKLVDAVISKLKRPELQL